MISHSIRFRRRMQDPENTLLEEKFNFEDPASFEIKEVILDQSRLKWGRSYHIYNRGNNRGQVFFEMDNYDYFMRLYKSYMAKLADLYAYCLLPNHFHLLLRINDDGEQITKGEGMVSRKFGIFLGTYVKAINNRYQRTGSLFEGRYQRKEIGSENQFFSALVYIHQNPQKHGVVERFQDWPFSSYVNYVDKDPGDLISPALMSDPLIYDSIMELHEVNFKDAGS